VLFFGGSTYTCYWRNTEFYDGTTWTEVNDLATARTNTSGLGVLVVLALCSGGSYPGPRVASTGITEEWTAPDVVINTLTTS
jgi:hypothetical protein